MAWLPLESNPTVMNKVCPTVVIWLALSFIVAHVLHYIHNANCHCNPSHQAYETYVDKFHTNTMITFLLSNRHAFKNHE